MVSRFLSFLSLMLILPRWATAKLVYNCEDSFVKSTISFDLNYFWVRLRSVDIGLIFFSVFLSYVKLKCLLYALTDPIWSPNDLITSKLFIIYLNTMIYPNSLCHNTRLSFSRLEILYLKFQEPRLLCLYSR